MAKQSAGYRLYHCQSAGGAGEELLATCHLQVANELFYRNKSRLAGGQNWSVPMATLPFLLPIHRSEEGELFVDTCLTTHAEASIVFGFSAFLFYGLCAVARRPGGMAARDLAG